MCGTQNVWDPKCVAPKMCGTQNVWDSKCVGPKMCGTQNVWDPECVGLKEHLLARSLAQTGGCACIHAWFDCSVLPLGCLRNALSLVTAVKHMSKD
jgi:hypothetical protein